MSFFDTLLASNIINTSGKYIETSEKGTANGVATLNGSGKVPEAQLPSYVDDVIEGYLYDGNFYEDSGHTTEITGETGKIYLDVSTDRVYRWSGSLFIEIGDNLIFSKNRALVSDANGKASTSNVTSTELGYVSGVTSAIQTQLGNITDSMKYSTTEQATKGVWTDGKTIYRKTISIPNIATSSSTTLSITHGITNLDKLIGLEIQMSTTEESYKHGVITTWNGSVWCDSTYLKVQVFGNWGATPERVWNFTMTYTKSS